MTLTPTQISDHAPSVAAVLDVIRKLVDHKVAETAVAAVPLIRAALRALDEAVTGKIDPEIVRIQLADLVDSVRATDTKHDTELDARFDDTD